MKNLIRKTLLITMLLAGCFFSTVLAEETGATIKYQPVTSWFKPGLVTYSVEADGKNLGYTWFLEYGGKNYNLCRSDARNEVIALGTYNSYVPNIRDYNKSTLIIENLYGGVLDNANVFCVITDSKGKEVWSQKATIVTTNNAPKKAPIVKLVNTVTVRPNTVVKLFCDVTIPSGADYGEDKIEYHWYKCDDLNRKNSVPVGDYEMIYIPEVNEIGTYNYYCDVYVLYGYGDFLHQTGVTTLKIYEPTVTVEYNPHGNITVDSNDELTLVAKETVHEEKDRGLVSYQWCISDSKDYTTFKPIEGATEASFVVDGSQYTGVKYIVCDVTNEPYYKGMEGQLEGSKYSSMNKSMNVLKVTYSGRKDSLITKDPENVNAKENETVTFSIKAEKVKNYQWYMYKNGEDKKLAQPVDESKYNVKGTKTDTMTIQATTDLDGYNFYCKVTQKSLDNRINSASAILNIVDDAKALTPIIHSVSSDIEQPVNSGTIELVCNAESQDNGLLRYQWYEGPEANKMKLIDGATMSIFTPVQEAGTKFYSCEVYEEKDGKTSSIVSSKAIKVTLTGTSNPIDPVNPTPSAGSINPLLIAIPSVLIGALLVLIIMKLTKKK